jgi:hypothetical protein
MATSDYTKDPDATLDWNFDWQYWLDDGETITTSTFVVDPGLTVTTSSHTGTSSTVWVSGGRTGQIYKVTNHIVTSAGRIDERSIRIRIQDR